MSHSSRHLESKRHSDGLDQDTMINCKVNANTQYNWTSLNHDIDTPKTKHQNGGAALTSNFNLEQEVQPSKYISCPLIAGKEELDFPISLIQNTQQLHGSHQYHSQCTRYHESMSLHREDTIRPSREVQELANDHLCYILRMHCYQRIARAHPGPYSNQPRNPAFEPAI
jgi:hypothetical protein